MNYNQAEHIQKQLFAIANKCQELGCDKHDQKCKMCPLGRPVYKIEKNDKMQIITLCEMLEDIWFGVDVD